jgi:RNA ligase (TIGR02306 family)
MKLASVERITEIKPIDGADKILAARVLGYWTVIKKDEFKVGDFCIWHQPDTIVDTTNPVYSFLKEGRLKVIKLRKQVSQGLALPLEKFSHKWPELLVRPTDEVNKVSIVEGQDVSDIIGIKKYEKPIPECMKGITKGSFPGFIPKTDENNLRSYPAILSNLYAEEDVYVTVKIDGQSSTYYAHDAKFGVCSRNQELVFNENNGFWKNALKYNIEDALWKLCNKTGKSWALQGESYGPGIQANKLGVAELSFAAFALYNITDACVASLDEFWNFCTTYEIPSVYKIPHQGKLENFGKNIDEILDKVNHQVYNNGSPAEGLVFRTTRQIPWADLRDLSGKIISEKFALKYGE